MEAAGARCVVYWDLDPLGIQNNDRGVARGSGFELWLCLRFCRAIQKL